ncbi:MAG: energy-coupling factor ABC transporter permease [Candidatus Edwardsbacteria bacterium]|nr:energy-coupling factor ABC transporter permease [Candidatus Edwardsbacteria bacterium]
MHIPDGFLSTPVWTAAAAAGTAGFALSLRQAAKVLKDRAVPRLALVAAFIFAAQMMNFPIAGGTSGHLLGGALAVALLGPWAASVAISLVLVIQCLVFQDGGVTALGANSVNMAFVGVLTAWAVQRLFPAKLKAVGIAVSSWASVLSASGMCAVELGLSGIVPMGTALAAMLGVHALIGIGEAAITALVYQAVMRISPEFGKTLALEEVKS